MSMPLPILRPGDLLQGKQGGYYVVTSVADPPSWLSIQPLGLTPTLPTTLDPSKNIGVSRTELVTALGCHLVARDTFFRQGGQRRPARKEVRAMDDKPTEKRRGMFGTARPVVRITTATRLTPAATARPTGRTRTTSSSGHEGDRANCPTWSYFAITTIASCMKVDGRSSSRVASFDSFHPIGW